MGAWGAGSFDNDDANDWIDGLEECDDLTLVRDTLSGVLELGDEYLEAPVASEALAACEVVARLKGNFGVRDPYTEKVDIWSVQHSSLPYATLVPIAEAVINRVLTPPSELLELWQEGDATEWLEAVEDLRKRVVG